MAKHGNTFFLQLSRELFTDKYNSLSLGAKWLFVVLNELEQRFTDSPEVDDGLFYRTNEDLAADAGISVQSLARYKEELCQSDLIETGMMRWKDPQTGKRSKERFTYYRIKK